MVHSSASDPAPSPAGLSAAPFPLSGSRAGRYQVMLQVELDALRQDDPTCGAGCSHLDDGVRVSHETSRRLSCDAAVVPLFLDARGRIAYAGYARRVVSPALRRALDARDQGGDLQRRAGGEPGRGSGTDLGLHSDQ